MTLYDDYRNTDYLDDVSFVGGTEFVLNFPIYDENSAFLNITASSMVWVLSLYGQPETAILQKSATISGSCTFVVTLTESDTLSLGDVYLQQVRITDSAGKKIRPAQGIVVIRKAIPIT